MFSQRSRVPGPENRIAQAVTRRRSEGRLLLDLTTSNATKAGLPYPSDLLTGLCRPEAMHYQPDPRGRYETRAAISAHHAESGLSIDPEDLWLTSGTSEAYAVLFKLLCDPGDEVLVPQPGYPLFEHLARLEGVAARPYRLSYDGRWAIDLASVRSAVAPRTRAIVAVSPNNPTGSFLKRDELQALADLGLPLISDEVFADFPLVDDPERVLSALTCDTVPVFSLFGLSKSAGLPQLKLSWIALRAAQQHRCELAARLDLISDCYLSVGTPVELAAPSLLARTDALRGAIRARLRANHSALLDVLGGDSPVTPLHVEGGWYVVLQLPGTQDDEQWVLRLLDEGVLVHPGFFYDLTRGTYIVLSLLTPEEEFGPGASTIARLARLAGAPCA